MATRVMLTAQVYNIIRNKQFAHTNTSQVKIKIKNFFTVSYTLTTEVFLKTILVRDFFSGTEVPVLLHQPKRLLSHHRKPQILESVRFLKWWWDTTK